MTRSEVRAAGGLVMRHGREGVELLLVHRPRYDDWSLPKGKLDPGESFEEAARREVLEETGLACMLGAPLPTVFYRDAAGREKEVRYWLMTVESGDTESRPADLEVDEGRWLGVEAAASLLTYPRDRALVTEALCIFAGRDA